MSDIVKEVIERAGGARPLARELGLHLSSIQEWERIPLRWVFLVEEIYGFKREELRPDIFARPRPNRAETVAALRAENAALKAELVRRYEPRARARSG